MDFFRRLFSSDFMPHGMCYLWQPDVLWLNVISDGLIALAYYSIPFTMLYTLHRRPSLRLRGLMAGFAAFILACGTTHLMSIWNVWHTLYGLEGMIKAATAALSIAVAVLTVKLAPAALRIPTREELERANEHLLGEMRARAEAEEKLRKTAEAARLSSEARMRSFLEAAAQGFIAIGADGRILLVNRRIEEMFGYGREELLGQELEILLPERYRTAHAAHRLDFFAEPRVRAMGAGLDLTARRKDGTEFPIEVGLSYTESDSVPVALGFVSDITERKKTEDQLRSAHAELRASEATLRSYLESASQAVLATTAEGKIVLVNRRTEQMFGYSRSELLGQNLEILLPARFREPHRVMRAGYFAAPSVRSMESRRELIALSKQGLEFPVEIGLSYVPAEGGLLALSLVSDISDRKAAAGETARLNAALRRSNAELEQFAYIASHDLQEPLRMVTSYLDLLRRRYADRLDDDAREFIGYAVDGSLRMKRLIQDVLNFSRVGTRPITPRAVESREILAAALQNLGAAITERSAEITCGELPQIRADEGLMAQVFQNLIGNSIKFTRDRAPHIRISAERHGDEWLFRFEDNGIGINPAHAGRIFQIFERLNSDEYPGTGVGLAVCKKIVERHGGRIWVSAPPQGGSIFSLTIPVNPTEIFPQEI